MEPTLAGFIAFLRDVVGINSTVLPDDSATIPMSLSIALAIVNPALRAAGYTPGPAGTIPVSIYVLAVYNLGADNVINFAPDVAAAPNNTYFADLRASFNTNAFVSGVIQSSNDESTGNSMVVQEAARNFTLGNLQNLKTPWGRVYLAYAQAYGPSIVGLS